MQIVTDRPQAPTAIRTDLGAIFVSLELSRSTWLVTSLSPGGGQKMSKHTVRSGDVAGLRTRFSQLKDKVQIRMGQVVPIIVIQEAGLDGFWIHRLLQDEGVESHVVDPASIATSRRRRRAKTDKIDGEALVRALLKAVHELSESEGDSGSGRFVIQDAGWAGGQHEWLDPIRWTCVSGSCRQLNRKACRVVRRPSALG